MWRWPAQPPQPLDFSAPVAAAADPVLDRRFHEARMYERDGDHDRAIELLSAEVEARPDNIDGWRWLALSLEKKGDDARLEPVLRQAIRTTRDPRPFQFMLARVMVRQQRMAEAVLLMQHFDPTGMSANVRDFKTTILERWGQPQGSRAPAPDSASVDSARAP